MVNGKNRNRMEAKPFLMMVITVILMIGLVYGLTWVGKSDSKYLVLGASIIQNTYPSSNPDYKIKIYNERNRDGELTAVYPFFENPLVDQPIQEIIDNYSRDNTNFDTIKDKIDYQLGLLNDKIINVKILTRKGNTALVLNRATGEEIDLEDIFIDNEDNILNHSRFLGVDIIPLLFRENDFYIDNDFNLIVNEEEKVTKLPLLSLDPIINKPLITELIPNYTSVINLQRISESKKKIDSQKKYVADLLDRQSDIDCRVDKCVALTFDGGPSDKTIPILDSLNEKGALSTFYVVGNEIYNRSEIFTKVTSLGHEIGNQTWSYPDLKQVDSTVVTSEISRAQEIIWNIGGVHAPTFRPPFGSIRDEDKKIFDGPIVSWDIDSLDWKAENGKQITDKIISEIKPSSIVLLHDTNQAVVDSVPDLIEELKKLDYKFVTISKLQETTKLDKTLE